jgi:predicted GIY-YIG superfamily endonuclease
MAVAFAEIMYYVYILYSSKSKNFYYGYTENIKERLKLHQSGKVTSTKPFLPWKLIWYAAFENMKLAKDFELYLKSGSGKAFAYKRLLNSGVLKKDK